MTMDSDTYVANGRIVTRIEVVGKEGDDPFVGLWVEGYGDIGDKVIGKYRFVNGVRHVWGGMFGAPDEWTRRGAAW